MIRMYCARSDAGIQEELIGNGFCNGLAFALYRASHL